MKSNFPEDVDNPKRAQLEKLFKALGGGREGGRGCQDLVHQEEEGNTVMIKGDRANLDGSRPASH